jgi:hypothetical protein
MDERMEDVLRRVSEGELTPEDADLLIATMQEAGPSSTAHVAEAVRVGGSAPSADRVTSAGPAPSADQGRTQAARAVRVLVTERGRTVVNLRIPMSWTGLASLVPGLSGAQLDRVTEALRNGERGRILDFQDADGDGVVISTE